MSIFHFRFRQKSGSLPFQFSVCIKQIEVPIFRQFRFPLGNSGNMETWTWRHKDMETRGKGDKETCKHGDMETYVETWRHGDMETQRHGDPDTETRRHGDMETRRQGDIETWRHGDTETWKHKKHVDVEKLMETWRYQTESEAGDFSLSVYHLLIVET